MTINALQAVLDRALQQPAPEKSAAPKRAGAPPAPPVRKEARAKPARVSRQEVAEPSRRRPVRDGKRFVGAHVHPEVARQLKMLAAEDGATIQELLEQAVDLLFVKNGRAKSAEFIRKR